MIEDKRVEFLAFVDRCFYVLSKKQKSKVMIHGRKLENATILTEGFIEKDLNYILIETVYMLFVYLTKIKKILLSNKRTIL